jgi:hypothetical protein
MPPTQSSSTSTTSSSEATTPRRRRPWKDAFAHSCSSRGSLTVSVREVTADSEVADVPTSSQVHYWNDTVATKEALARLFQEQSATAKARETAAAKASPSLVSSVASTIFEYGVKSPVKMAIRYMLHDDDEDEYDVPDVDSDIHVGEDEPLLNPDVAVDCLLFLRQTMLRHASDTLVLALPGGAATAATELLNWTHGVLKTTSDQGRMGTLVAQLETSQMEFLAEILMASGLVEAVSRDEGDDLLVLIPPADARQREQRMALYDLQLAIAKNEMRMAELTAKMEVCTKRALESNKTGNRKVALQHMAARKRLTAQLVQVEGALVNLTGQFHALEGALHTQKFVQVTKQTAAALKSLRPDLDEVDDVMLDLEEELEADRRMNDTLSNMVMTDTTGPTDDELLAELAGLTLDDAPEKPIPAPIKPVPPVDDAALEAKLAALGESLGSLPAATGKQAVAS